MEKTMQHTDQACRQGRIAIKDALDVVGGKWKLLLITILLGGKKRFRELSREAEISPKILSKELQELEMDGLVDRKVCDTRPVTVEYSLTPYSQGLVEVLTTLEKWGHTHRERAISLF
ncbi:winged helix-turn-helix transcriptional regulator [Pedobacter panaciterrae]|uniref:winged helix-turn-helix transcriptional regulator n=1 Tax=Pedobacter panaciterrae TaxID=363849 RepID=UPI002594E2D7|nr:helix-turn-helix domain-containing protein [uncultured Pedobacter sp.]